MTQPTFPPAAERHETSRRLYLAKDLQGYIDLFAPDVAYKQANGTTITRDQLARNVADQFHKLGTAEWTSEVESEDRKPDEVVETVRQTGVFVATAFGFLHRVWRLERRGRYTWRVQDGLWKIAAVEVLEEKLTSEGTKLGGKPTSGGAVSGTTR